MAADSRLSLNSKLGVGDGTALSLSVGQTDSTNKLFQLRGTRIGIATVGDADAAGVPIGGYMQGFEDSFGMVQDPTVEEVAEKLLEYFRSLPGPPKVLFYVAGYCRLQEQLSQQVWEVKVAEGTAK